MCPHWPRWRSSSPSPPPSSWPTCWPPIRRAGPPVSAPPKCCGPNNHPFLEPKCALAVHFRSKNKQGSDARWLAVLSDLAEALAQVDELTLGVRGRLDRLLVLVPAPGPPGPEAQSDNKQQQACGRVQLGQAELLGLAVGVGRHAVGRRGVRRVVEAEGEAGLAQRRQVVVDGLGD